MVLVFLVKWQRRLPPRRRRQAKEPDFHPPDKRVCGCYGQDIGQAPKSARKSFAESGYTSTPGIAGELPIELAWFIGQLFSPATDRQLESRSRPVQLN
jgi:hypothetical protein